MTEATKTLSSLGYSPRTWSEPGTSEDAPLLVPAHRMSPDLAAAAIELVQLSALRPGWNSYGASPVQRVAIQRAVQLLVYAGEVDRLPRPSVCPTPKGGVQLEWGGEDEGVEIEVQADGSISLLIDVSGQVEQQSIVDADEHALSDALHWAAKLA